jgi:cytochrome c oxidase assembly protein subunit 15
MARRFRPLALAAAASLYVIVITGSLVRLTDSGLGCESWPGCQEGAFFPAEDHHGFIEFGNRVFGAVPVTLTLLTWIASRRAAAPAIRTVALATFLVTLVQAPIGLIVIATELEPIAVVVHFVLALVALAGAIIVAMATWSPREPADEPAPTDLRRAGLVLAGACLGLVVTGTLATAAGPHSGDPDVGRLWVLDDAMWVHVRAAGVFGLALLFVLGYLVALRARSPFLLRVGFFVAALAVAQAAVGELQWQTELPWGIVLVHVALAAALWAATVVLVALLHRRPNALT